MAVLFFMSGTAFSQTVWKTISKEEFLKVLEKVEKLYRTGSSYSVEVSHASFKDYATKTVHDKSTGYFIKDSKNNYHSYLMGIHTVQNEKYKVVADSAKKSIMVSGRDASLDKAMNPVDFSKSMEKCTAIKYYVSGTNTLYRVEFSKNYPYNAYEMETDADAQVKKLILYFNSELPLDPNDKNSKKSKPRVEITFSNYKKNAAVSYSEHFDHSKYILQKQGKWIAAGKFKDCKVMNLIVK